VVFYWVDLNLVDIRGGCQGDGHRGSARPGQEIVVTMVMEGLVKQVVKAVVGGAVRIGAVATPARVAVIDGCTALNLHTGGSHAMDSPTNLQAPPQAAYFL